MISLLAYRRTLDPWRGRVIEQQTTPLSRRVHEPWVAPSADELHARGYVLSETEGWLTYRAPGLDALSSDEFVQDHCFRMVAHDSTRSLVGVAFEPTRARRDLGEIRGVAWLDRATSELRRIEFRYVNVPLPHEEAHAGGMLRLARLDDGAFFISEWHIRLPVVEVRRVRASGIRSRATVPEATFGRSGGVPSADGSV